MLLKIEKIEEITISDKSVVKIWINKEKFVELSPEIAVRLALFFNKGWGLIAPAEDEDEEDDE